MKKAVFFDIDGTLLGSNRTLAETTKKAIAELQKNNIFTAIATGRGPNNIQLLTKELNMTSFVGFNGQYVVYSNKAISKNYLDPTYLKLLTKEIENNNHQIIFLDEIAIRNEDKGFKSLEDWKKAHMNNLPLDYSNIFQAILFAEEHEVDYLDNFSQHYSFVRWGKEALDIIPTGRSKVEGIKSIVKELNIDMKDVYAFGDGLNDIEMLQAAGVGVAMGNAHEKVKKHADFITSDADNDGIVRGLQEVGLLSNRFQLA
ncbi:Cof-type HAD-IIB family hydrolase [Lederbergia panacisoli]|uniref:Cof-type HAD-IIB family hydrolase n=1 Tax=Lederbergia panacisoli TaxID=1255251 RepID=UPI00214BE5B1|nr:Cof-type HAD-IIB family hydrolase [Lederbergia panacisoli]MCR2822997.1 Cof-type HAD-IIB family hydrolase [Lederbergia panacisoli]